MHRVHQCITSPHEELCVFKNPNLEIGIEEKRWFEYRPTNAITKNSPLEFDIKGSGEQYLDLKNSILALKVQILDGDGKDFTGEVIETGTDGTKTINSNYDVGPVNLFLHSIISQVEISFQQEIVSNTRLYPYKSYLETLYYPYDVIKGETELYVKDTPEHREETSIKGSNEGLFKRGARTLGNKICDMEGNLHLDLFQQNRYLLNGVDMKIRMWPSTSEFCTLTTKTACTVKIVEAVLKICKVSLRTDVFKHHENMLSNHDALYPFLKTQIKTEELGKGLSSHTIENVFQSKVPCHLIFGLVETKAFSGNLEKNPYNFQDCKLTSVGVYVNDIAVPHKPHTLDFNGKVNNTSSAYRSMFINNPHLNLTRDEFEFGTTLFKYHLYDNHILQEGNCKIQLTFGETLKNNMTLIILAKFPNTMTIDKDRAIHFNG